MDIKEIQALLEKYFEGETTLEEDQALFDYFSGKTSTQSCGRGRNNFCCFNQDGSHWTLILISKIGWRV